MPRVQTLKANKNYKAEGIKKGEMYYKWKRRTGPVERSKTYPRPTQLSLAKTALVEEAIEDAHSAIQAADSVDDMKSALEECASIAREIGEEYGESISNMESAFPSGCPAMEECQEKQDALESFADECEGWEGDTTELDEANAMQDGDDGEMGAVTKDDAIEAALAHLRGDAESVLDSYSL